MKSIGNCLKLALFALLFSIAAISCSNDAFFGFENDDSLNLYDSWQNTIQSDENNSLASNLSKISFNVDENGCFHITDRYDEKLGLSRSDYDKLVNMMYYTNDLLNSNKTKRIKSNNREGGLPRTPDCFLYSLSHYGHGAPSYGQIAQDCDIFFPDWRSYGVPDKVQNKILTKHSVVYQSSPNGFGYNIVDLDNAMVFIDGETVTVNGHQYILTHCVNGQSYYHDINGYDIIYYCDYQTMRFGLISIQSVYKLYHHPSIIP